MAMNLYRNSSAQSFKEFLRLEKCGLRGRPRCKILIGSLDWTLSIILPVLIDPGGWLYVFINTLVPLCRPLPISCLRRIRYPRESDDFWLWWDAGFFPPTTWHFGDAMDFKKPAPVILPPIDVLYFSRDVRLRVRIAGHHFIRWFNNLIVEVRMWTNFEPEGRRVPDTLSSLCCIFHNNKICLVSKRKSSMESTMTTSRSRKSQWPSIPSSLSFQSVSFSPSKIFILLWMGSSGHGWHSTSGRIFVGSSVRHTNRTGPDRLRLTMLYKNVHIVSGKLRPHFMHTTWCFNLILL